MLPPIPNEMALYVALQELTKTKQFRDSLNELDPSEGGGAFLSPFIEDLENRIREYVPTSSLPCPHCGKTLGPTLVKK